MERIDAFVRRSWGQLAAGKKINVPTWQVEHPKDRPDIFSQPAGAWPVGQTCDHVMRFQDGSRVHAQCMTISGQPFIRLHRDRYDPDHSLGNFVMHGLTETPIVPVLGVLALLIAIGSSGGTPAG